MEFGLFDPAKSDERLTTYSSLDDPCVNVNVDNTVVSGLIYVRNCELDKFKPLWFKIDTHWYMLAPNSYLIFNYQGNN